MRGVLEKMVVMDGCAQSFAEGTYISHDCETMIRGNADPDGLLGGLFALDLAENIRDEEGRREQDVAERHLHAEGVHEDEHFDVRGDGGQHVERHQAVRAE